MKMLSTILYKDAAVCAMMAGRAYCLSRRPIFSVPNSVGIEDFPVLILLLFRLCNELDFKD